MDMGLRAALRRKRALRRYIHVSTGPAYLPRSSAPGHVRGPLQTGITYAPGNNQKKRIMRALRAGAGPASLMARVNP